MGDCRGFATGANTAVVIDEISKGRYLAAAMWAGFGFVCGLSAKGRWASMKNATNQLETMIEGRQIK